MKEKSFILTIYFIAIAAGLFFIIFNPHTYGSGGFDGYDALGCNLAEGNGYSFSAEPPYEPTAFRLPGYAIIVAAIYKVFGHHFSAVHILQLFINAFIPVIIYYTIKILDTQRLARVSSFIVAMCGISNLYVSTVVTEVFTVFLTVFHTLLLILAVKKSSYKWFVFSGLTIGYGIIIRPGLALLPAFYILFLLFIFKTPKFCRKNVVSIFLYAASIVLWCVPWAIRNYAIVNDPVLLGTQGGSQFFYGALDSGTYFRRRFANPWAHYEELSAYAYDAKSDIVFDAIVKNNANKPFIYYAIDSDVFKKGEMVTYGLGRYIYRLHSPPKDTSIKYFFAINSEQDNAAQQKFPVFAPNSTFRYYVGENIFADIDAKGEFIDVYDFVECVRIASSENKLSESILKKYDYDYNGSIGLYDINIIAWAICHPDDGHLYDFGEITTGFTRVSHGIEVHFVDGSIMFIPHYFGRDYEKLHIFSSKGTAFDIFRGYVNNKALMAIPSVKTTMQEGFLSAGVDRFGIKSELNRQFLQRKLGFYIIKKNLSSYVLTTFKRIFFMWITLGSADISISHPPPGGHYIYFTLATIISVVFFLAGIVGIIISVRESMNMAFIIIPIIYFPLTHSFVMVNARHTLPVNPYILTFCSVVLIKVYERFQKGWVNFEKS